MNINQHIQPILPTSNLCSLVSYMYLFLTGKDVFFVNEQKWAWASRINVQ